MCWLYVLVLSVGVGLIVNLAAWCTMPCRVLSQVEVLKKYVCQCTMLLMHPFVRLGFPSVLALCDIHAAASISRLRYCGGIHQAHKDRTSEQRDQGLTLIRVGAVVVEVPVPL